MRTTRGFKYNLPPGKGALTSNGYRPEMTSADEGFILTAKGFFN